MPSLFTTIASLLLVISAADATKAIDESLATLIEQAKVEYRPVTPEEVESARADLATSAIELERFLLPGSQRGEAWKRYLQWQGVQESLREGSPFNAGALRDSLDKFRAGADGTRLPVFRRTADSLERYTDLATIGRVRDQKAVTGKQLDRLRKYLDRYEVEPSARARYEIERRLEFFGGIGRSLALHSALRSRFNHPNIRLELSEPFLNRIVSKSINKQDPVNDCILGTTIRGTGSTTGYVTLQTLPSSSRAALLLQLTGTTLSQTRGYKDPVVIRSHGTTNFRATKRIELEDTNFWNYPAQVNATTSTQTCSVKKQGGGFGSRLVEKIGKKKVAEKKPQTNAIAADHAEVRIADSLEKDLLPKLQDARFEYLEQFKKPLENRNASPRSVAFSTTDHSLSVDILQAGRGQLGADRSPPPFPVGHAVAVRLHETGAANLAAVILSGATLSQKTREGHPKLDVVLPKKLRKAIDEAREKEPEDEDEDEADEQREFKPWSIRFRRGRPVTIEFAGNLVKIRLHATRIAAGEKTYHGWDLLVDYVLHPKEGGLTLVRNGPIEVIPTAFDPADGKGLSNKQVGLRGNLAKELNRQADAGRGFPEEIDLPAIDLPGDIAHHGPLLLQDATSEEGWLSLGWRLP